MLENARGSAMLATADLARARAFYEGTLGLTPEEVDDEAELVTYRLGGVPLSVYRTSYAGTAKNTVFGLETDDLDADMTALRAKGVEFLDYDFPGLKTVDGVADLGGERSSWFTDADGNIIGLFQRA